MFNRSLTTFLSITFFIFIDWLSKLALLLMHCRSVTEGHFVLYQRTLGNFAFSLIPVFNEGAAFGLFSKYKYILFALRICIVMGMLFFLFFRNKTLPLTIQVALILLSAGALGNIGDILFHGHVIDFLSFSYKKHFFPTFNLADVFISLGTIIFVTKLYFPTKQKRKHR